LLSDPGSSRSRCANFFSRSAFLRENEARPRASLGAPIGGAGESSGETGVVPGVPVFSVGTVRSLPASGSDRTDGIGSAAGSSTRKGTSASIGRPAVDGGGSGIEVAGSRDGECESGAIGGVGSGLGGPSRSPGLGASGGTLPSARLKDSHRPGFRGEESSEGSASRGCGRPKRRSGATGRLYSRSHRTGTTPESFEPLSARGRTP
jgi:hypothetical protein